VRRDAIIRQSQPCPTCRSLTYDLRVVDLKADGEVARVAIEVRASLSSTVHEGSAFLDDVGGMLLILALSLAHLRQACLMLVLEILDSLGHLLHGSRELVWHRVH